MRESCIRVRFEDKERMVLVEVQSKRKRTVRIGK